MLIMKDGKVSHPHLKIASSPSYTLAELNGLAREFITEQEHQGHYPTNLQLVLSLFLAWTGKTKREQGKGGEG